MAYPLVNQDIVGELVQLEKQYQNFTAIPNSWYSHLLDTKGQVYSDAILVLAEIINWYRLVPIYDRSTRKIIDYQKKFKLDLLQKSYKDFEDKFCFSKEKTRRILDFLIQKKLIYKEMRTLKSKSLVLSNVMFIGIHVENINKLNETSPKKHGVVYHFLPGKVNPLCENTLPLVTNLVGGSTKNLTTYTEITPEITKTINESLKEKSTALEAMLKAEIEAIYQLKDTALTDSLEKKPSSQTAVKNQLQATTQAQPKTTRLLQKATCPSQILVPTLQKPMITQTSSYKPFKSNTQRFIALNEDEKKYLDNLLSYKPVVGEPIPQREATWWVKSYGIAKIKTAVQVYIQQVEKSLKNSKVKMPRSMGSYVRNALDKDLRPCLEHEKRNRRFAEEFKKHVNWTSLVIIEKYCRAEHTSKEWYYTMLEEEFRNALKDSYYNNFVDQKVSR